MVQALKISDVIDESPISAGQVTIAVLCALVVFMDGFSAQSIGYVAPTLVKAWHLKPAALGPVFTWGLAGLMLGALFIAPLADRIGRRPLILVSTAAFGLFSLGTVFVHGVGALLIMRFLTGLGLGGCMPNAIAATSECAPRRSRPFMIMLMFSGFTIGSLVGGLIAGQMVTTYGWQGVFAVGGVLPLLLVAALAFLLPESPRFLLTSGAPAPQITALLKRICPTAPLGPDTTYLKDEPNNARMSVASLFKDRRALATSLLWIVFFCSLLDVYLLVSWLPTVMNAAGASMKVSIWAGALLQFGGFIGGILLGLVFDRWGPGLAMAPAYVLASVCIAAIGFAASTSIPLALLAVFGAGFGIIGGQTAANALSALIYPTEIRSTGVGWALGVGRIGSIVGPGVAGVLLGLNVSNRNLFLVSAIPALVAAVAAAGVAVQAGRASADIASA